MAGQTSTQEFSICLLPTDDVQKDVKLLRSQLAASPYRDDMPHPTLLRGITANDVVNDATLLQKVDNTLHLSDRLPISLRVKSVTNQSNRFYSSSDLLALDAPPKLLQFRKKVTQHLKKAAFSMEDHELLSFTPHITLRLGGAS